MEDRRSESSWMSEDARFACCVTASFVWLTVDCCDLVSSLIDELYCVRLACSLCDSCSMEFSAARSPWSS